MKEDLADLKGNSKAISIKDLIQDSKAEMKNKYVLDMDNSLLPSDYGKTKIVILPKDPIYIFTYWEITQNTIQELLNLYKDDLILSSLTLRIYDITDKNFDGTNANRYFDIGTTYGSSSWYINVGEYNRTWVVDIGYFLKYGNFIKVARSNVLKMPRFGVSNIIDEQWASLGFNQRYYIDKGSSHSVTRSKRRVNLELSGKSSSRFKVKKGTL